MKNNKTLIVKSLGYYVTSEKTIVKGLCSDMRKYTELDIILMRNAIKYNN